MSDEQKPGTGEDQSKDQKPADEKVAEDQQRVPAEDQAGDKDGSKASSEKDGDAGDDEQEPSEDEQAVFAVGAGAVARTQGESWVYTDPEFEAHGHF